MKELEAQVKVLTRRVAELEARLRRNSTNTSKPPSSDSPGVRRPPREPTGRRPGGQPGHESHLRELLPPEQVDRFIEVPAPERCTRCNGKLEGGQRQVLRHQLVEIPPPSCARKWGRTPASPCGCPRREREILKGPSGLATSLCEGPPGSR
ncbi:DUF6444 domain-containing protein [Cystobacter fuscus]